MKILKNLIFIFIFSLLLFPIDAKASSINGFMDYIKTQSSVEKVKTTILPNQNAIETKDSTIKIVSTNISEIVSSNKGGGSTVNFVIGETRAISEDDYYWLTRIVQCEAGGEDEIGKILVANVIFNRFDTGRYGDTLKGVIFAHNQFSPVGSGAIYNSKPSDATIEAVRKALDGVDYSDGALYFMNRAASGKNNVTWFDTHLTWLFEHGGHEFFK